MSFICNPGSGGGGGAPSNSILLKDADGIVWALDVTTNANLQTSSLGPQAFIPAAIILVDASSNKWNLTVTTAGNLETEAA